MKKLFVSLLSGICLTIVSTGALAAMEPINIGLSPSDEVKDPEHPSKGQRLPAAPVICTIDFENHRIVTSIPYEITAYELWDEEGNASIASYPTDYDLVEYMSGLSGVFQLRLVTSEYAYIGYLDL